MIVRSTHAGNNRNGFYKTGISTWKQSLGWEFSFLEQEEKDQLLMPSEPYCLYGTTNVSSRGSKSRLLTRIWTKPMLVCGVLNIPRVQELWTTIEPGSGLRGLGAWGQQPQNQQYTHTHHTHSCLTHSHIYRHILTSHTHHIQSTCMHIHTHHKP